MEDDTWSFGLSTSSSRSYQSALKSLSGMFKIHFFFYHFYICLVFSCCCLLFFFSFRVFFFTFVNYKRWVVVETDLCIDFEDIEEEDDDLRTEYPCPYCTDDFDLVELCFHIDEEHYLEAKSGVFYFTFLLFKNITFLLFIV
jgi:hypothetical protein